MRAPLGELRPDLIHRPGDGTSLRRLASVPPQLMLSPLAQTAALICIGLDLLGQCQIGASVSGYLTKAIRKQPAQSASAV
jgi:hypothetical protein